MFKKSILALVIVGITILLLTACGNSSAPALEESPAVSLEESPAIAPEESPAVAPEEPSAGQMPTHDNEYAEYAGYPFSGMDPWEGTLTITIRNIMDGKMEWSFTDSFEDHTLYQIQKETVLDNARTNFDIQGKDVEHEEVTFAYKGSLELKDGTILVTFDSGAVMSESPEGGSSFRMVEALSGSGLSNQVVLVRTADGPYMNYVVQEGDSIHSIAKEFGISTKELAILNQIVIMETAKSHGLEFDDVTEYVKYLYPGEELLVPSSK